MVSSISLDGEKGEKASLIDSDLNAAESHLKAHKAHKAKVYVPKHYAPKAYKVKGVKAKGHTAHY